MLSSAHTPLPDFFARCRQRMAIFYDKNSFCHVSGREAGLEGALVYYKRMTNSIWAFVMAHAEMLAAPSRQVVSRVWSAAPFPIIASAGGLVPVLQWAGSPELLCRRPTFLPTVSCREPSEIFRGSTPVFFSSMDSRKTWDIGSAPNVPVQTATPLRDPAAPYAHPHNGGYSRR